MNEIPGEELPSPYSGNLYSPEAHNSWSHLIHLIPEGTRVLDIGCSSGNFGAALQDRKGCTVIGIDINAKDVALAAEKLSEAHVVDVTVPGALTRLGTFDVVLVADVLEHLVDPRSVLVEIDGVLREKGILVYSIPHMGYLSVRLDLLEGAFPYTDLGLLDRTHLHFYDRVEIHDMLASAGFQIVSERPVIAHQPERWVTERLHRIGLKPAPDFYRLLDHTEAHVYQYVGIAEQRGKVLPWTRPDHDELSPPDAISQRADLLLLANDELRNENTSLRDELSRVEEAIVPEFQRVSAELERLREVSEDRLSRLATEKADLDVQNSLLQRRVAQQESLLEAKDALIASVPPRVRRRIESSMPKTPSTGA